MSNLAQIGVVGVGFVGTAVARGFNLFADIKTYDKDAKKCTHSFEETIDSDFIFVCLPTPMTDVEGGQCDLSIIEGFFDEVFENREILTGRESQPVFIIKSTVPVGTTARLNRKYGNDMAIVHSPEFLTARSALFDFLTPARNIVGGLPVWNDRVELLYNERFPGIVCYKMKSNESEMIKYMANCFFATKVMFFNEMRLYADKKGIEWKHLIDGVVSDGRIANSHCDVPGHDGDKGFGGSCFPKDINAMIHMMKDEGLDPKVMQAVWDQNMSVRDNWDWADNESAVSLKSKL